MDIVEPLVGGSNPTSSRSLGPARLDSRRDSANDENAACDETRGIQHLSPSIESDIASMQRGGEPLPASEREFFEPRFRNDFGDVRIHADPRAARLATTLEAQALTVGRDVAFARGSYAPGTPSGRRLLAHELTHVMQQDASGDRSVVSAAPDVQRQLTDPQCAATGCNAVAPSKWSCASLQADIDRAVGYLNVALANLRKGLTGPLDKTTANALSWYFHRTADTPNDAIQNRLIDIWARLMSAAQNGEFVCTTTSGDVPKNAVAFVTNFQPPIKLTERYFGKSDRLRAQALIHEAAHLSGLRGGTDDVYGFTRQFRTLTGQQALDNADSYTLFASSAASGGVAVSATSTIGAAGGVAEGAGEGETEPDGWFLSIFFETTLQHPVLHVFNPALRASVSLRGIPTEAGPHEGPSRFSAALMPGIRIEDPRPQGGAPHLSFFGGPMVAATPPYSASVGTQIEAAAGYRWSVFDLSFGASFIRDPGRLLETKTLVQIGPEISVVIGRDVK